MARHISSSHHLLKSLLEERVRLNEVSGQPGIGAQPLDAHSGQSLPPPRQSGQGSLQPLHNDTNDHGLQPLPPTGHNAQPLPDHAAPLPVHSGPSNLSGDKMYHNTQPQPPLGHGTQPQPPLGHSGQPDIHPQSSCLSSMTDVSTSMNLTQVKYLREKTNHLFVFLSLYPPVVFSDTIGFRHLN